LFILKSATESFSRKNAFRSGDRVLALSEARTMGLEHLAKVADDLSKL
jgi:hypothetical protein